MRLMLKMWLEGGGGIMEGYGGEGGEAKGGVVEEEGVRGEGVRECGCG
jgi:hypothetical protein